jgi:hypothetical protein
VLEQAWESSPHCGHLKAHPQEAEAAVRQWLMNAQVSGVLMDSIKGLSEFLVGMGEVRSSQQQAFRVRVVGSRSGHPGSGL